MSREREKMSDAREIGTIFCWKIHGPWTGFQDMQGILTYSSSNLCPHLHEEVWQNSLLKFLQNMASFTTDVIKCNFMPLSETV
jgi:hypothetical protein